MKVPLPFSNLKIDFIYVKRYSGSIYLGPHFNGFLSVLHHPRGKKEQNRDLANEEVPQYLSNDGGEMKSVTPVMGLLWSWWST